MEPHRQGKRILVVDDDPDVRSSLGRILTTAGHEVILAENGIEATGAGERSERTWSYSTFSCR